MVTLRDFFLALAPTNNWPPIDDRALPLHELNTDDKEGYSIEELSTGIDIYRDSEPEIAESLQYIVNNFVSFAHFNGNLDTREIGLFTSVINHKDLRNREVNPESLEELQESITQERLLILSTHEYYIQEGILASSPRVFSRNSTDDIPEYIAVVDRTYIATTGVVTQTYGEESDAFGLGDTVTRNTPNIDPYTLIPGSEISEFLDAAYSLFATNNLPMEILLSNPSDYLEPVISSTDSETPLHILLPSNYNFYRQALTGSSLEEGISDPNELIPTASNLAEYVITEGLNHLGTDLEELSELNQQINKLDLDVEKITLAGGHGRHGQLSFRFVINGERIETQPKYNSEIQENGLLWLWTNSIEELQELLARKN